MILSNNATEKGLFGTYASLLQFCSILQQPRHFLEMGEIRLRSVRKTESAPTFSATPPHLQLANPMPLDYLKKNTSKVESFRLVRSSN